MHIIMHINTYANQLIKFPRKNRRKQINNANATNIYYNMFSNLIAFYNLISRFSLFLILFRS